jgi:hypothetical protein
MYYRNQREARGFVVAPPHMRGTLLEYIDVAEEDFAERENSLR